MSTSSLQEHGLAEIVRLDPVRISKIKWSVTASGVARAPKALVAILEKVRNMVEKI